MQTFSVTIADERAALSLDAGRHGSALSDHASATQAQVAVAWLLSKGDDIVPIPGTKHVSRDEENVAAETLELSEEQLAALDNLAPAEGCHHTDDQMRMIER